MSDLVKWWSRVFAAATGAVLTLVVPVHAWAAANGTGDVAVAAVRYRRRGIGFGIIPIFGGLCCLLVIGAVALVVLLISRNRRRGRPSPP